MKKERFYRIASIVIGLFLLTSFLLHWLSAASWNAAIHQPNEFQALYSHALKSAGIVSDTKDLFAPVGTDELWKYPNRGAETSGYSYTIFDLQQSPKGVKSSKESLYLAPGLEDNCHFWIANLSNPASDGTLFSVGIQTKRAVSVSNTEKRKVVEEVGYVMSIKELVKSDRVLLVAEYTPVKFVWKGQYLAMANDGKEFPFVRWERDTASESLGVTPIAEKVGRLLHPRVSVLADEESVANEFLSTIERAEFLRTSSDSDTPRLKLSKTVRQRLLVCISDLLRYRLAGESKAATEASRGDSVELSAHLRWATWFCGADTVSWYVLSGIYIATCLAGWIAFRWWTELRDNNCSADKTVVFRGIAGYIEYVIPALGFLGTIAGLGSAFGTVGIISSVERLQKGSLMEVLLSLGTAFSTTFIALLAGVVVTLLFAICRVAERRMTIAAKGDAN